MQYIIHENSIHGECLTVVCSFGKRRQTATQRLSLQYSTLARVISFHRPAGLDTTTARVNCRLVSEPVRSPSELKKKLGLVY